MQGILLDTNVLSELMRPEPEQAVMDWFARHPGNLFFVSAITQAEINLGIALLPAGKRRNRLAAAASEMFSLDFAGRCLAFDAAAAVLYAKVVTGRRHAGRTISTEDAQIAAIALAHGQPLATRNTKDFEHIAGLTVHNPWQGWPPAS